jgi:aspartyl-tRNA(Asn)/glutamyl-tRNA(Gln) amidotransferase subunit A
VGLKPTYGAVSRYGIIVVASSLDQVGPMARTVEDCETLFDVIRGRDPLDSTSVEINPKSEARNPKQIQNLKIGVPKEYFGEGLDPKVEKVIKEAIQKLENAGAKIIEVSLPHSSYALADYYIINMSEISANLARYDGVRYGAAVPGENLLATYMRSRGEKLGAEVKRRIMLGTYALSAGYYDAYYAKAQKVRALLKKDFEEAFEKVDVVAGPVSPFLPFKIGEKVESPLAMYLVDIYTVTLNLAGLPGLSVPAGSAGGPPGGEAGLPVGLQLIAPAFGEQTLFETGKAFETLIGTI